MEIFRASKRIGCNEVLMLIRSDINPSGPCWITGLTTLQRRLPEWASATGMGQSHPSRAGMTTSLFMRSYTYLLNASLSAR
jgi:hypothetical protein